MSGINKKGIYAIVLEFIYRKEKWRNM